MTYNINNQNRTATQSKNPSELAFFNNLSASLQTNKDKSALSVFENQPKKQISEKQQQETLINQIVKSHITSVGEKSADLYLKIKIYKDKIPDTAYILTTVKIKTDELINASKKEFLDCKMGINSNSFENKDFDGTLSLLETKSSAINAELDTKMAVFNTIVDIAPFLVLLKDTSVGNESGLKELVFQLIDGVSTPKAKYSGLKNVNDVNKLFKNRMNNAFGQSFTPEKITKKLEIFKTKRNVLKKRLLQAKKTNNGPEMKKCSLLLKANSLSTQLLTTLITRITGVTKKLSQAT